MSAAAQNHIPRGLRPVTYRPYRRMWFGAFISNIGTWVEAVALGIYITDRTGQAAWTGLVAAAGLLPGVILSPLGGALADRFPRKALLIVATLLQLLCALVLALLVAFDAGSPMLITIIVAFAGGAGIVAWPTYSAILPELVPHEELPAAVALNTAQWNLGRVLGPAVAGLAIALAGYTWAFAINAVSFLAVIVAVLPIAVPRPGAPEHRFLRSIRAGFEFVRRDRGLRHGLMLFAINCFIAAPFIALVPAVALKVFDNKSPGTAILVTAQGIGAVIMAVSLGTLTHRLGLRRFITIACGLLPLALAGYALSPNLVIATGAIFVLGGVYLGSFTGSFTVAQTRTPRALRGRMIAFFTATLSLCFPLGSIVQGWLGDRIGLRQTTLLSAGLLVLAYGLFAATTRGFLPGLDDPLAPGASGSTDEPEAPVEIIPD